MLIALLALALLGAGAFMVFGGQPSSDSPVDEVRAFYEAAKAEDCPRLVDLLSERSWSEDGEVTRTEAEYTCKQHFELTGFEEAQNVDLENVELKADGSDRAVLEVTVSDDGDSTTFDVVALKEDGKWRLDLNVGSLADNGA